MRNVIEIEKLTKNYGKNRGVENISFQVKQGEIFGFLGQNGAGKSTTIRAMLGFIQKNTGEIRILGRDAEKDRQECLKEIGYMPSEEQFYPSMTVKEVIKLAADVRGVDCQKEAEKLCRRLQLDTKKKIKELSLGNKKKVSIVCAMQHKPKLFIFDEPTSGLDPFMQAEFFKLIHEYVEEGASCMLSTHVLSEVRSHCNRVAIMKDGKLMCVDTVENLTKANAKRVKVTKNNETKEFVYKGDMKDLLKELAEEEIQDVLIEEPSIEEIFMHYYEKKEEPQC